MKTAGLGLKAKVQYSTWDDSNWYAYYHALSGDELKNQIMSIFYKPTGDERSWEFSTLSAQYKAYEEDGIRNWIAKTYNASPEDVETLLPHVLSFLNDACSEFNMKPLVKATVKE